MSPILEKGHGTTTIDAFWCRRGVIDKPHLEMVII